MDADLLSPAWTMLPKCRQAFAALWFVAATKKEVAKLQGTWEGVSAEVFGWK